MENCTIVKKSSLPNAGFGLYANQEFEKGDFVAEFLGEFLTMEEAKQRTDRRYMFQYTKNIILDSKNIDCLAKYANSSRKTTFQNNVTWIVDYRNKRVYLKATRKIQINEEIFAPYRW